MPHYPNFAPTLVTQLEAVALLLEADPGYLLNPACPYPEKLRGMLRRLAGPAGSVGETDEDAVFERGAGEGEQLDSFMDEVQSTINSMKRLAQEMAADKVDMNDKITFLKNYAPLLERFLNMKEKTGGLKQMYDFQRVVTSVMEEVLDKDGRLDFKNRLKQVNSNG